MKRLSRVMRFKLGLCSVLAALSIAAIAIPDQRVDAQSYTDCGWGCEWIPAIDDFGCREAAPYHDYKCGQYLPGECWTQYCYLEG
jgi:hypothetical protein